MSLARANRIWLTNVEEALQRRVSRKEILISLEEIKLVNDLCAEDSLDILKLLARSMWFSITAR